MPSFASEMSGCCNQHVPWYKFINTDQDEADTRYVKFGIQIGQDLPKMGQNYDFLRPDSVHFGSAK